MGSNDATKTCPNVYEDDFSTYRQFNKFGVINAIKNLKAIRYLESPDLLWCLKDKLPIYTRGLWNRHKVSLIRNDKVVNLNV